MAAVLCSANSHICGPERDHNSASASYPLFALSQGDCLPGRYVHTCTARLPAEFQLSVLLCPFPATSPSFYTELLDQLDRKVMLRMATMYNKQQILVDIEMIYSQINFPVEGQYKVI
jgi:hypothetical protein